MGISQILWPSQNILTLQLKKLFQLHQIYQENKENYFVLLPIKDIQIPYGSKELRCWDTKFSFEGVEYSAEKEDLGWDSFSKVYFYGKLELCQLIILDASNLKYWILFCFLKTSGKKIKKKIMSFRGHYWKIVMLMYALIHCAKVLF